MTERFTDPTYFSKYPFLEYGFMLSAVLGQVLTQAATMDVLPHMNQLQADFHAPSSYKPWYMASFGLSVGTIILMSGRYGDVFGIRKVIVWGYAWSVVWSLLCGIAYYTRHLGPDFYICCRTFQGIGPAFVLPNVIGAVGRVYTPGTLRKKVVVGLIGLAAPMGGWIGCFMSGVIGVKTLRWDWNYYAFAIACFAAAILAYVCVPSLPPIPNPDGTTQDLDIVGSILGIGGMALFNFVWNQAPIVGWGSAYIIVLLVVGVVMIGVFAYWELKFARGPLIPHQVLSSPKLMMILLIMFLAWGAFGINIYHSYTLLLDFRHYTPFAAGATISPAPVMGFIAALGCSFLVSDKTTECLFFFSTVSFTAMSIVLATVKVDESYWRNTFGMWIIGPMGMETSVVNAIYILSEAVPPRFQGAAGSLVTVAMNYGIATFLGIAGTVEEQLLEQRPDDAWRSWRGAVYFSVGTAGLSAVFAFWFAFDKVFLQPRKQKGSDNEKGGEELSDNSESSIEKPEVPGEQAES